MRWILFTSQYRETAVDYSNKLKSLSLNLMGAILESLGVTVRHKPNLALGLPPHSNYRFLMLLYQDESGLGLQIQHEGRWIPMELPPNTSRSTLVTMFEVGILVSVMVTVTMHL
ncbi:probable 2-oxoglutarate-dependent dioxygenase SLC1 [Rhodamnia argentea]|uniref:Probable 2-oxoglutarate-dependent dioxygenase SLC1 n=1 Tax=Rhodamnia argentea TaxID=178133 RepID=A0A8B8QVX3_9MYRT|nr:probable 2-oxoglutarate-dependent dioxygenase SLC1 [Rhodamnia argentea]